MDEPNNRNTGSSISSTNGVNAQYYVHSSRPSRICQKWLKLLFMCKHNGGAVMGLELH